VLAFRVAAVALLVGALVTGEAWAAGGGACSGAGTAAAGSARDPVCFQLVHLMAERIGLLTAAATVVVVLMTLGVARLTRERPSLPKAPEEEQVPMAEAAPR
jgi:hypothetical protein